MATKFRDFLNEQMKDEDFRREYEALEHVKAGTAHIFTVTR